MKSDDLPFAQKRIVVLHDAAWTCAYCCGEATEADHIWPKKWGGTDDLDNLQALCRTCNARKGDRIYLTDITPGRIDWRIPHEMAGARNWVLATARWRSTQEAMVEQGSSGPDAYHHYFDEGAMPEPDAVRWVLAQLWMELLHETPGHAALDAMAELEEFTIMDALDMFERFLPTSLSEPKFEPVQ